MNLRCRGPLGQATLSGLDADALTVLQFCELLAEKTGVPTSEQELLAGFPPTALQLPLDPAASHLSKLPLATGDSIVVRRREGAAAAAAPAAAAPAVQHAEAMAAPAAAPRPSATDGAATPASPANQTPSAEDEDEDLARAIAASLGQDFEAAAPALAPAALQPLPAPRRAAPPAAPREIERGDVAAASTSGPAAPSQGAPASVAVAGGGGSAVVRREIASDNSCLFNAVGYVMEHSRGAAADLRRVIAETVAGDPEEYSEAVLGKPNGEYCRWICEPARWGGAIELSILARHFAREIAAYDVQTKRCDVYGQGAGYAERVLLIYDGLHYDALAVAAFEGAPEEYDITVFETSGSEGAAISNAAAQLVAKAHEARQFTDTANFALRCGVCQIGVKGEKEAVEHAKATGHQRFGEY